MIPPLPFRPSPASVWWTPARWRIALIFLVIATFVIRARYFGNPLIDADEQFYLLTGDRMLHGAVPYRDIWDRKPVGLFVLYAAIRLLGGDGILQYQMVAAVCVIATALLIAIMARRITTSGAALIAALSYAPSLALSGGAGGQTPVFYNLLIAGAAALVLTRCAPRDPDRPLRPLRWRGAGVLLLVGIAIQIKYNAVFEGMYFGLVLLVLAWRADPRTGPRVVDASLWILAALAPTIFAYLAFIGIGERQTFEYAIRSIFARSSLPPGELVHNFLHDLGRLAPYLVAILFAEILFRRQAAWRDRPGGRAAHLFLAGWAAAAVAAFLIFGTYFNHYILPLLAPLAIIAAPAFAVRARRLGTLLGALFLGGMTVWFLLYANRMDERKGTATRAYEIAARIRPLLREGCLFIFYDDPIYYQLTNSCLLTRWPFPFHLSLTREAPALGVDPMAEMRRIIARRPSVVLDRETRDPEVNQAVQRILQDKLRRNYRLVYIGQPFGEYQERSQVWERSPAR